jgi:hypothetical protein
MSRAALTLAVLLGLAACRAEGPALAAPEATPPAGPAEEEPATPVEEEPTGEPPAPEAADHCVAECIESRQMQATSREQIEADCRAECAGQ